MSMKSVAQQNIMLALLNASESRDFFKCRSWPSIEEDHQEERQQKRAEARKRELLDILEIS